MKATVTWILVANGVRGRIFVNRGPGRGLEPLPEGVVEGRDLPSGQIMSDRPGRTFDSVGGGRHAKVPHSDPVEVEKQRFTQDLTKTLDQALGKRAFARLVLVAPPKELGRLRNEMSDALSNCVSAELNKDLTHLSPKDLAEHLGAVIAL